MLQGVRIYCKHEAARPSRSRRSPLLQEGLQCGYCGSGKLFVTSASRAGHYRKCQAYQLAKSARGTVAEGPEDPHPYGILTAQNPQADVTPDGPRETLSHLLWECLFSVG
ncbi:uncharacterized protein Tco025E_08116 [Trypanosoma conorhini]|uniref:Uncharacterized protein n=1 Tax=Trypanosoma conorhini TaxID=83891 RepID=A0A422NE26_9TRYP|nr:uncharacterized protein Tco025E_08116 [Trypanosoma conorhini]RNF03731.1 hypothetical protein Tco025E_08116 [Trypanosoma conorhini]